MSRNGTQLAREIIIHGHPPFPSPPASLTPRAPSTLPGIYRPRSFVLVKRIINTYNGFLTPLPHPMLLFCRGTRPLREKFATVQFFFLRLHFSLSPLCSHFVFNASLLKGYVHMDPYHIPFYIVYYLNTMIFE